mgnify:CR=1 FL=1
MLFNVPEAKEFFFPLDNKSSQEKKELEVTSIYLWDSLIIRLFFFVC